MNSKPFITLAIPFVFGFLKADNPEHKQIIDCILKQPTLPKQPDVWMQITIPTEFAPVGKFNIGVTAGIETTICDPSWIEGLNRMNLNLVSSEHAKKVFQDSKFEKRNQQTQQVEGIIELKAPVEVLFEGADLNIASFLFGDLREANLKNTNMYRADLSQADLTGADLTNANLTDAIVDGAIFTNVKGLSTVKGFSTVKGKCHDCGMP